MAKRGAFSLGGGRSTQRTARLRSHLIEPLASMVSGLLEGTGCAIVAVGSVEEEAETVAVTGTWETADLGNILDEAGCGWVLALADVPMVVVRGQRGVLPRAVRRSAGPSAIGAAFPAALAELGGCRALRGFPHERTAIGLSLRGAG